MRNVMKRSGARNSKARRSVRGLSAVLASLALTAGLASYPVEVTAQESEVVSDASTEEAGETGSPIQVRRGDGVDFITVDDQDGEAWGYGAKASDEDIFALKRTGGGEIREILKVSADGKTLDPEFYGFVNTDDGGFLAFDIDALNEVPPRNVQFVVRTSDEAEYAIAESDEVPTARDLSDSGYGQNPNAAAEVNPDGVGVARAATLPGSQEQLTLTALSYNVISGAANGKSPRGTLSTSIGGSKEQRSFYLTELVVTYGKSSTYSLSGPVTVRKNSNESCTVESSGISTTASRSDATMRVDLSSCDPQIAVWKGSGDSIKVDFDGPGADPKASTYSMELYGSYSKSSQTSTTPTTAPSTTAKPTSTDPSTTAKPTTAPSEPSASPTKTTSPGQPATTTSAPQGESDVANGSFRVVAETDPGYPITLSNIRTTGDNPYRTTAQFDQRTQFSGAVVEVKAPDAALAVERYEFRIDMLESGVTLGRRLLFESNDAATFEVFPERNGSRIDSALVENGSIMTAVTSFRDKPEYIDSTITIRGRQAERREVNTSPIKRPESEKWLEPRLPNPELAKKCGLKVAIVADLSTSLNYADTNGFEASREAATAMVDSLAGTPTEIGIYHFARQAGADTARGPVSLQDSEGVEAVKKAIQNWSAPSGGSTNWEAGLKEVQNQNFDVVYFITDGMPTWDDTGWQPVAGNTGAYVQERSLNQAIKAANTLKAGGTRVVPIMVDLTLKAGNVVTRDYVLKNVLPNGVEGATDPGQARFQRNGVFSDWSKMYPAVYKDPGDRIVVNMEQAQKQNYWTFYKDRKDITADRSQWTYGLRDVRQMGEDISGDGDPIRVRGYELLKGQFVSIADGLKQHCEGSLTVQKRIVKEDGTVQIERAKGWTFTVASEGEVLDAGNGQWRSVSTKTTGDDGVVRWRTMNGQTSTFTVDEARKDPYRIFKRDGANAVCSLRDAADSETSFNLPIDNNGEFGFRARVPAYSHVSCVVDNFKPKDEFVRLELQKLDATDKTPLSSARFQVRSNREGDGPLDVVWDQSSQTYKTETKLTLGKIYSLVETQAPNGDGRRYALLTEPVEFRIISSGSGYAVEIRDGDEWVTEVAEAGLWTDKPQQPEPSTGYIQVANVRQGDLPKTGGYGLQVPILLGSVLIAAGSIIGRRVNGA